MPSLRKFLVQPIKHNITQEWTRQYSSRNFWTELQHADLSQHLNGDTVPAGIPQKHLFPLSLELLLYRQEQDKNCALESSYQTILVDKKPRKELLTGYAVDSATPFFTDNGLINHR